MLILLHNHLIALSALETYFQAGTTMNSPTTPERNATFDSFGGTATLIHDYQYWSLQARPKQATLGALILLAHGPATAFADLDPGAHAELSQITQDIERLSARLFGPQKYNYLMLMMVDPHVHFHVLPRYDAEQSFGGFSFADPGWPALPDLTHSADDRAAQVVHAALRDAWTG